MCLEAFFIFLHKGNLTFIPSIQPSSSNTYCVLGNTTLKKIPFLESERKHAGFRVSTPPPCSSARRYSSNIEEASRPTECTLKAAFIDSFFFVVFFLRRGLGEPAGRDRAVTSAFGAARRMKNSNYHSGDSHANHKRMKASWTLICERSEQKFGMKWWMQSGKGWRWMRLWSIWRRMDGWTDSYMKGWMMDGSLVDGCNTKWMHAVMNEWKTEWMHGRTPDWWKLQREWMKWWWPTERVNGMNNERGNHRRHPRGFRRFCRSSF